MPRSRMSEDEKKELQKRMKAGTALYGGKRFRRLMHKAKKLLQREGEFKTKPSVKPLAGFQKTMAILDAVPQVLDNAAREKDRQRSRRKR